MRIYEIRYVTFTRFPHIQVLRKSFDCPVIITLGRFGNIGVSFGALDRLILLSDVCYQRCSLSRSTNSLFFAFHVQVQVRATGRYGSRRQRERVVIAAQQINGRRKKKRIGNNGVIFPFSRKWQTGHLLL